MPEDIFGRDDFSPFTIPGRNHYPLRELAYADFGLGESAENSDLYKSATSIVGTGLSALSAIANVIDKPRAAVSGALAYLGSGNKEHLKNVLFMLPFSESYLRGTYEKVLGTKLPSKHITGREVLTAWGAEPNRQGFHPIRDPRDAVLDALGLALEIASYPPIGPSVGSLTRAGTAALGKSGAANMSELFRISSSIREIPRTIASTASSVKTAADRVNWYANLLRHFGANEEVVSGFKQAVSGINEKLIPFYFPVRENIAPESVQTAIRTALQMSELDSVLSGGRAIPRVGVGAKIDEIAKGERALVSLKPAWPLKGESLVDFTGPAAAKVADVIVHNPMSRFVRHLFDWTTRGMYNKSAAISAEYATDVAMQIKSAADDIVIGAESMLSSVADQYTKLAQVGALAGDVGTSARLDEIVRFVTENIRAGKYSVGDRYEFVFHKLFGPTEVTDDKLRFINDIMDISVNTLAKSVDKIHGVAEDIGIPTGLIKDYFTAYFPRYSNPSEYMDLSKLASIYGNSLLSMKSVGKLLSSAGKRRMTMSRMNALRHVPGGTVAIDWASRHPFLSQVLEGGAGRYEKLVARDSGNKILVYGDYITDGTNYGRFLGIPEKVGVPQWVTMNESGVPVVEELAGKQFYKTLRPRGLDIPVKPLYKEDGYRGALEWFEENGIDISKELGLKNSEARYRAVMSRFLRDSVLSPFLDVSNPLTKLMHVLPDEADAVLGRVRRELQSAASQGKAPKMSRRVWSRLEQTVKRDFGLNGALLDYLGKKLPGDLFTNGVLDDFYEYMKASGEMIAAVGGVYRGMALSAFVPKGAPPAGSISLVQAFSRLGIPVGKRNLPLEARGLGVIADVISKERPDIIRQATMRTSGLDGFLGEIYVPESSVKVLQGMLDSLSPGNESRLFIEQALGKFTQMLTSWMTLPRVAFHTRNYVSQVALGVLGDTPYSVSDYIAAHKDTFAKLVSGNVKDIKYYDEIVRSDILKKNFFLSQALHETGVKPRGNIQTLGDILSPVRDKSAGEIASSAAKVWQTPWGGPDKPANVLLDVGRRVFDFVESATRIPIYQAARDAGLTPSQAQETVKRLLYDYSRLSSFERRFAQRGLLFYSWTRNNLPAMFTNTALRWTTGHARVLHGYGRLAAGTQEGVPMPGWLADTMPVVWPGEGPDGKKLVIRQFGLPIQDLALLSPDAAAMQARFYAQSHPLIKAAYKLATGRDPYTQMPIKVRKSALERAGVPVPKEFRVAYRISEDFNPIAPIVSQFASAFAGDSPPLARVIDATTGVKIDRYDIKKLGYLDVMKKLEKYLLSRPESAVFSQIYIPEEELNTGVTPETQRAYGVYSGIRKEQQKERREREKVGSVSDVLQSPLTPLFGQ